MALWWDEAITVFESRWPAYLRPKHSRTSQTQSLTINAHWTGSSEQTGELQPTVVLSVNQTDTFSSPLMCSPLA